VSAAADIDRVTSGLAMFAMKLCSAVWLAGRAGAVIGWLQSADA